MFIFPDKLEDDAVDAVMKDVRADIEKQGGEVLSGTRLGRRPFARPLKKTTHGHYAVVLFKVDPNRLPSIRNRFKLNEQVLRVQFIRASEETMGAAANAGAAEETDG
jgi:ribosomal protein S6